LNVDYNRTVYYKAKPEKTKKNLHNTIMHRLQFSTNLNKYDIKKMWKNPLSRVIYELVEILKFYRLYNTYGNTGTKK
jgi:hypothetical protein